MNRWRWAVLTIIVVLLAGAAAWVVQQRRESAREVKNLMLAPVSTGMEMAAVRQVLGSPVAVESKGRYSATPGKCGSSPATLRWVYTKSSFSRVIYFDADGKMVCDEWVVTHV
jgi:hypothetical protein